VASHQIIKSAAKWTREYYQSQCDTLELPSFETIPAAKLGLSLYPETPHVLAQAI
jgi:hypothetical protein